MLFFSTVVPSFYSFIYVAFSQFSCSFVCNVVIASNYSTLSTPLLSTLWFRSIISKEKSEYISPLFKILQWFFMVCRENLNCFILHSKLSTLEMEQAHFSHRICHYCLLSTYVPPRQDKHPTASYLLSAHCSQGLNWFSSVSLASVIP